jgi:hypothetical protein
MPELDKQNIRSCIAVILGLAEEMKGGGYKVSDSDALRLAAFAWMATELERLRETIEDEAAMVRVQGALRG